MSDKQNQKNMGFVYLISFIAAVGGILFGYDTAVIAGAIGFLQTKFGLSAAMKGWAASSALIGCMIGAAVAGKLSDTFGRKKIMIVSAIFFAVSSIGTAVPPDLFWFVVMRILGGLAVGAASMLSPLYISEIAPANIRGKLVSLNQLGIVSGILIIYFVNSLIANMGNEAWNVELGWRWMFGSEIIPSLLFLFLLFIVPESPRWLAKQKREDEALKILTKISGEKDAIQELKEIKATLTEKTESITTLLKPGLRTALLIGVMLSVFSQITGINAIMYYAPEIFKEAGAGISSAFGQTVIVGAINLLFTFVAIWGVDWAGRKALLLVGAAGMAINHLMIGLCFYNGIFAGPWILIFILLFIASFAASYAPVTWVVMAEIFPTKIRGRAMAISTFAIWVGCYLVSQSFPILLEVLGPAHTFFIYMAMSVFAFIFVLKVIPETKGRTLEEIEQSWYKKGSAK